MPQTISPQPLERLEADVHSVREAIFEISSVARRCAPHELTQLHVSLQLVANELGQIEHMLYEAQRDEPVAVGR